MSERDTFVLRREDKGSKVMFTPPKEATIRNPLGYKEPEIDASGYCPPMPVKTFKIDPIPTVYRVRYMGEDSEFINKFRFEKRDSIADKINEGAKVEGYYKIKKDIKEDITEASNEPQTLEGMMFDKMAKEEEEKEDMKNRAKIKDLEYKPLVDKNTSDERLEELGLEVCRRIAYNNGQDVALNPEFKEDWPEDYVPPTEEDEEDDDSTEVSSDDLAALAMESMEESSENEVEELEVVERDGIDISKLEVDEVPTRRRKATPKKKQKKTEE